VLRRFVADGLPLDHLNSGQGSWHTSPSKITFAGSYAATLSHKEYFAANAAASEPQRFFSICDRCCCGGCRRCVAPYLTRPGYTPVTSIHSDILNAKASLCEGLQRKTKTA
jgi:hypothetical protein